MVDRELVVIFLVSIAVVGAITVFKHEIHYQSRKERILEERIKVLEEIIGESRGN
jgi:uncharacterized iron-regulated membrane protein